MIISITYLYNQKYHKTERVTFSEYPFINDLVNDIVSCQKDDIEYPDLYHWQNKIQANDPSDKIIRYTGDEKSNK